MRRVAVTALLLIACAILVLLATGAKNEDKKGSYWVELDNAFGLIGGADVKVAGVRAGKIGEMKLDQRTKKALVQIKVNKPGFGGLRKDAFCETRPQSLIGEYFVDCQPGTSPDHLKPGGRIAIGQTASTVGPDLINDILRLPYRQRLSIIVNELGTGLAGRSGDLNAAIRRAVPALRETDKVLKILGDQNRVIRDLVENSDTVIGAIARNKRDVGRWVVAAKNSAQASAERRVALAETFHRLPAFLTELRPTMRDLGRTADAQTPALRNLNAAAGQLRRLFTDLGPFANASRPAFRSLGQASDVGRQAVVAARPTVNLLRQFATNTPELGKNLAITLEHLDDRQFAAENDPRSPGGQGYTGLEALLTYVFDQTMAINIFDQNGYLLKVSPFYDQDCAPYADRQAALDHPKCGAALGPNQPGINQGPINDTPRHSSSSRRRSRRDRGAPSAPDQQTSAGGGSQGGGGGSGGGGGNGGGRKPPVDLGRTLGGLLPGGTPDLPKPPQVPPAPNVKVKPPHVGGNGDSDQRLLDYLLSP